MALRWLNARVARAPGVAPPGQSEFEIDTQLSAEQELTLEVLKEIRDLRSPKLSDVRPVPEDSPIELPMLDWLNRDGAERFQRLSQR